MSYDVYLLKGETTVGWWNYTSNIAPMLNMALESVIAFTPGAERWHDLLHGCQLESGRELLGVAVRSLESDPERYRAMNPANGWGDYDSLLGVLREMRDFVAEQDVTWNVYC